MEPDKNSFSAFPSNHKETWGFQGLSKRELAAIQLKIPCSGNEEIDKMIELSIQKDATIASLQGLLANSAYNPFATAWEDILARAELFGRNAAKGIKKQTN